MITDDDIDRAPRADTVHWYKCDGCENLHVVLCDEENKVIATMVLSEQMLVRMMEVIHEVPVQ